MLDVSLAVMNRRWEIAVVHKHHVLWASVIILLVIVIRTHLNAMPL
jgi:hypothetical protein